LEVGTVALQYNIWAFSRMLC